MLVIAYVLRTSELLNSLPYNKEDSAAESSLLLLLHRVVLQAPTCDCGDIWDVCVSEFLVS